MMDKQTLDALARLQDILDVLRVKCPWDRDQTSESLKRATLEEACELAEAIDEQSPEHVKEELGDLLLHIFFYSRIGTEQGTFSLADVANGICEKLIYRHPHVFGDAKAATASDVLKNWDTLKQNEGRPKRTKFQKFIRRAKYGWQLLKA